MGYLGGSLALAVIEQGDLEADSRRCGARMQDRPARVIEGPAESDADARLAQDPSGRRDADMHRMGRLVEHSGKPQRGATTGRRAGPRVQHSGQHPGDRIDRPGMSQVAVSYTHLTLPTT